MIAELCGTLKKGDGMIYGTSCRCQRCRKFLGHSPGILVWTGFVKRCPDEPDGLEYKPCDKCRVFNRFEIVAPNPVQIILPELVA